MTIAYDEHHDAPALEVELAGILQAANVRGRQARAVAARCPFQIGGLLAAADIVDVEHCLKLRNGMIVRWGRPYLVTEPASVTG